jgi:hypothetical protein
MVGFELKAEGSNGFRRSTGAWTEGSLIALKIAMSTPKVNPPGTGKPSRGILDSIEASFGKIAKYLLRSVCSDGMNFTLFLTGDIKLKFFFDYSKSGDQLKGEFLKALAGSQEELGDQVMIHLCRTIQDFIMHNFDRTGDLVLKIDVDL